jgi:formylmethanofuran dehydrogenase subunit E
MNEPMKKELRDKGDLTTCKKCGKHISKRWHREKEDMENCAPCYFKKKS